MRALLLVIIAILATIAQAQTDSFAGPAGTLLEAHSGTYAWSRVSGDGNRSLALRGDGTISGTGAGNSYTYAFGAPLPANPSVSLVVNPMSNTDTGGPMLLSADGASYAFGRCAPRSYHIELIVVVNNQIVDDVTGADYWGVADDYTMRLTQGADGTITLRLGDGQHVHDVSSSAAKSVVWTRAGIHADHVADGDATQFSQFALSGTAAGVSGVLHSRVSVVDVRASSDAEAVATAQAAVYSGGDSQYVPGEPQGPQLDTEAYEALASLPPGSYPNPSADTTLSIDLPKQLGYEPSLHNITTIGPRSAARVYRVYVVERDASPMPLASAQAFVAGIYAVPMGLGRAITAGERLMSDGIPWAAYVANPAQALTVTLDGKSVPLVPIAWAAFKASDIALPTLYVTARPVFAVPIDTAIVP